MVEVDENKTVFCWKIRAPRMWTCEVRGILSTVSQKFDPVYAGETDIRDKDNWETPCILITEYVTGKNFFPICENLFHDKLR